MKKLKKIFAILSVIFSLNTIASDSTGGTSSNDSEIKKAVLKPGTEETNIDVAKLVKQATLAGQLALERQRQKTK